MMRTLNISSVRAVRGVAIIMVIAILAGLLALAAPFVFSMVLHERGARSDVYAQQAREGAEAATAHALAQLHKKTLYYGSSDTDTGPQVTTLEDLKVSMDIPGAPDFNKLGLSLSNPNGTMWSAKVEDEQGKINLNTVPPVLLGNLLGSAVLTADVGKGEGALPVDDVKQFDPEGGTVCLNGERDPLPYRSIQGGSIVLLNGTTQSHAQGDIVYDGRARTIVDYQFKSGTTTFHPYRSIYEIKASLDSGFNRALTPEQFAKIERHITLQSGLGMPLWAHGARPLEQSFTGALQGFSIEKGDGFTPGGLIRVVQDGVVQGFGRVYRITARNDGSAFIALENNIGISVDSSGVGSSVLIEPQLRHPVNINTASIDVIEACVMGVCMATGREAVNRTTAELLADELTSGKAIYADSRSLGKALDVAHDKGILTLQQRDAVFINATEPNSPKLRTSTVTFCFHSFGSFTIEGAGVVNSDNGVQFARHVTRQLVTLPTPYPGRFKVEYQSGFQDLIDQGQTNRVVTFPVALGPLQYSKNAPTSKHASTNTGNVRLDVGESGPMNLPGEWIEHCNDENDSGYRQDGYDMRKRKAFILSPTEGPNANLNNPAGAAGGGPNQQPVVPKGFQIVDQNGNRINPNANNQNGTPPMSGVGGVACQPTSVELWYKPNGGGQCVFYEEGLADDRNRVTFSYDPSKGLMLQIYDAGLECQQSSPPNFTHLKRDPVEYDFPAKLNAGDWYHVAGSWKTSFPGGQEVRVDARPVPDQQEPVKFYPGSLLAQDIATDDITLSLEESRSQDFPKAGAVKIGEEIIEYGQRNGSMLTMLQRGARLSAAAKHSSGEFVLPYGYSNNLAQDLPVGGATLVERIEAANATHTNIENPMPPPNNFYLSTETKEFRVDSTVEFPPSGFINVEGELIYYGSKTANAFQKLVRAQQSGPAAPARNIHNRQNVSLSSIQITDGSQYDPSGIVQIDNEMDDTKVEWFGYGSNQNINGKTYLVAQLSTGTGTIMVGKPEMPQQNQLSVGNWEFRGKFGIGINIAHAKKAKVIPVTRMSGPQCGNQRSPYGDQGISEVSVVQRGMAQGDLRYVKQAYINQFPVFTGPDNPCHKNFQGWAFDYFVGLDDFVSRRYTGAQTRLLKFPSGELPDAINAQRYVGANRNGEGQLSGYVDELIVNTHAATGARIAMNSTGTGITESDTQIQAEEFDFWPVNQNGNIAGGQNARQLSAGLNAWPVTGLIRIEDELIYYTAKSTTNCEYYADVIPVLVQPQGKNKTKAEHWVTVPCPTREELHPNLQTRQVLLLTVVRGVLNSKTVKHEVGTPIMLYDGMPISTMTQPLMVDGDVFAVQNAAGFPNEGYAWMGNEVVSWLKANGNSFQGCKHFRGRFGTSRQEHEMGEIVRCLPFRYWDRQEPIYDGPGQAFIQAGYSASDATWENINVVISGTEDRPKPNTVRPRVLVRFDGKPAWDADPTNSEGGLYEFRGREGIIALNGGQTRGVRADQIEIRVYWQFKNGAFDATGKSEMADWKRTFSVDKLSAAYSTPLIMRRLDEIEKR